MRRLSVVCPDQLSALFFALLAVRVVGFYATFRPEVLPPTLLFIEEHVAPWWRWDRGASGPSGGSGVRKRAPWC